MTFSPGMPAVGASVDTTVTVECIDVIATGDISCVDVTAAGAVGCASAAVTGGVGCASVTATGDVGCASVTATGTVTCADVSVTNSVTVPALITPEIRMPGGILDQITITSPQPNFPRAYTLPDIGTDGELVISNTYTMNTNVTNLLGTVTYTTQNITVVRHGKIVSLSFDANVPFDGGSESALTLNPPSVRLPVGYRPSTDKSWVINTYSSGVIGTGFATVTSLGAVILYPNNAELWGGADCRIYPTNLTWTRA